MPDRQAATILFALGSLAALSLAGPATALTPCTYFAAPVEAEGGRVPAGEPFGLGFAVGTPDRPIPVSDFWKRKLVKPGTVLCLKDGEYRGGESMIDPPPGLFAGAAAARVEIRAVNDGRVWIDGEFERSPLRLGGQHYWTIAGLNLLNSRGPVVGIAGTKQEAERDQDPTRHVILRRLVAWRDYLPYGSEADYDAVGGPNVHIFSFADVEDLLVEDCAGFGWARKIFQNYRAKRTVIRRSWARWDGRYPYKGGNKFAFACSYRSFDTLCENLVATVGGSRNPAASPESYAPRIGLIGTDGSASEDARWVEPPDRDVHNVGLRIVGSLAYVRPGGVFEAVAGLRVGGGSFPSKGVKGVVIENSVASVPGSETLGAALQSCDDDPVEHPGGCSWKVKDDRGGAPLTVRRVTVVGGRKPGARISEDWSREKVQTFASPRDVDIYRGSRGPAALCKRYVEGRETPLPLWPWPMNERILEATERSVWQTADVTADVAATFGAPPPECTFSEPAAASR